MLKKILGGAVLTVLLLGLLFVGRVWWLLQPRADPQPLPAGLVSAVETRGKARLADAEARADYEKLVTHFESQAYRSYCGVASSVTVRGFVEVNGIEPVP